MAIGEPCPTCNSYVEGADGKPPHRNDTSTWAWRWTWTRATATHAGGAGLGRGPALRFLAAYEDLIRKVKTNKLAVADFQGANISLTNPGTIGTVQSVPRLMPGQAVIVGVGSIDYPAEFQGADERTLGSSGVSKVITVTSTYDHRIIQGAESGLFLACPRAARRARLNDDVRCCRRALRVGRGHRDVNPIDREEAMHKQMQVATLIRATECAT